MGDADSKTEQELVKSETVSKITQREFEEARRYLLNLDHSYAQNHAGYLLAIIVGSLTLISSWESFYKHLVTQCIFWLLIVAIIGITVWVALRIVYWTTCSDVTLSVSRKYALKKLGERVLKDNVPIEIEPSCPAILQYAVERHLVDLKNKSYASWIRKLAIMTARLK